MALPIDVTDPGNSNVESQAFGRGIPIDVTPGSDVADQFASASVVNAGIARVGPPPDMSVPGLGVRVDVDPGDDVAEQSVAAVAPNVTFAGNFKPGLGVAVTVTGPGNSDAEEIPPIGLGLPAFVSGDASFPRRGAAANVTQNNVAGQVYGTGTPANVFV